MKRETRNRKNATKVFKQLNGESWLQDQVYRVVAGGKMAMDQIAAELGRTIMEAVMYMEREQLSGPDYYPHDPDLQKWASQPGSVYLGDQKIRVNRPRLRSSAGEMPLPSYERLKDPSAFSEELLQKMLSGLSGRRYQETVVDIAGGFGISPSSVSCRVVEATAKKLHEFKERDLANLFPFAIFLDTVHRGGQAFTVGLGIDGAGDKALLGFWEGATENAEIAGELLADLERRGLKLGKRILWITDGGKGIIKALKDRFGKKLLHQRCTIHKDRNLQRHLPKRYRKEAHRRFRTALEQNQYADAKAMLQEMERWLRKINESAADSLLEAFEEILTLHRLKVPAALRKTLHSTNPIENVFSKVRDCEKNIRRYRNSAMAQRWLAAVCLHAEAKFRRIKGAKNIPIVIQNIETYHQEIIDDAA